MKKLFIIAIFLLVNLTLYGQFKFQNDRLFKYHADSLLLKAGINHADFDKTNFELRFWVIDLNDNNASELFILQNNKMGVWQVAHYQICLANRHYKLLTGADSILGKWDGPWNALLKNNILSLPDEEKVWKNWHSSKKQILSIADGTLYLFELSSKKAKRKYGYSNPDLKLENYDLNNKELVNINHIVGILENQFKFKEHSITCRNYKTK